MSVFSPETIILIENQIGYTFNDKLLLQKAFVHRSYFNEHKEEILEHNERLEFLGDAVLGLVVSKYLFNALPHLEEGALSHLRSRLIDAISCAHYTTTLGLGAHALLGKGEKMNDGRGRDSIYADLFEALVGALFLDAGFEATEKFFLEKYLPWIEQILKEPIRNFKADLQEFSQKKFRMAPVYKVLKETGPEHNKHFLIAVYLDETPFGEGEGISKKHAEQNAAKEALSRLETYE